MSNTADSERWGRPAWNDSPSFWETPSHPGWIALMILGFVFWWPIGLAILAYIIWGRKMYGCGGRWQHKMEKMQYKMEKMRSRMEGRYPSSGNRAFDEYRTETLRRLEDEQNEFKDFLNRLRHAKDKAEFDQFMSERRSRPPTPPATDNPPQS
ncbi:DUF2852 domain-containing protein [Bradyrhizobium sp. LHD-71]|uniref:DUF2852 domain-containing protein n=1 Tax=Bradyrhizobium sp. LHD-71 TaxID=3072141 RepID=UPI00280F96EB|nr:DUF2852 domain-containing protein [Bradyrhizobium sp. LHD-71]MDQ8728980.1 DUF2852 domain-containing protein [Bradyrhizobium sp. LHD-71]